MAKWKPTFYRTNGHPGATAPLRKVATKFLTNMKHRNEELGNYINPVQRFQYDGIKFVLSSLPGYDIVDITVPFEPGEEEVGGTAEIYSGFWEPRVQAHGIGHYLRWFPSDYELYNSDSVTPIGLGASVDGASEELSDPMPPNRWMYNDYSPGGVGPDDGREEAPWFKDTGQQVSAASIHPGKYSGKLRELVQMQLGYGLLPQFNYTASNSNGIHLEALDDDVTRIWLYQISATNGIVMQVMMDYTDAKFEKAERLKTGEIPPEITEQEWFSTQTSFDSSKPLYTKAEWDALPEAERPAITTVTFELLSAAAYLSVVSEYGAYGDYGWSFNPAGTSAVFCGMAWNTPGGGGLAANYKSNLLTVTLNPTAFTASVSGAGDTPFLMDSAFDHVKFPNSDGTLETVYFWKGENGFKGTQPSSSYTAPIYTYYNLNGALETVSYTYTAGTYETQNGGSGFALGWAEYIACREPNAISPTNYNYAACGAGQSGTGTMGARHGFTSSITTPDSFDNFLGYRGSWSSAKDLAPPTYFGPSSNLKISYGPTTSRPAGMNMDSQYLELEHGNWGGATESVLIIPSFERLGYYHYKSLQTTLSSGSLSLAAEYIYEHGTPVRQYGDGSIGSDDCEYNACTTAATGRIGNRWPSSDTQPNYYLARNATADTLFPIHTACSPNDANDCFSDLDGVVYTNGAPAPILSGHTKDDTTYVGGLMLPDGSSIAFSDDEIVNQSSPFRESSSSYGYQSVVSLFDTFSGKYIFSMPEIAMTARKHTATGFPDDITKTGVLFSGMPYFL